MSFVAKFQQFHLNKTAIALLCAAGLYVGGYAALYRLSDYAALQQQAQSLLHGTQRTIRFDPQIGRQLFPRPTIIIRNAVLSEQGSNIEAAHADEIRIGVAWSSLLGSMDVEKLVINRPEAQLVRKQDGSWNIGDLWNVQPQRSVRFNRIYLNEGTFMLRDPHLGSLKLDQLNATISRSGDTLPYTVSAAAHSPYWDNLQLNASGNAQTGNGSLNVPDALVNFTGKEHGNTFSGSIKAAAAWSGRDFSAENIRIETASNRYQSTYNVSIAKLYSHLGDAEFSGINGVFTAAGSSYQPNGTLRAAQAMWRGYRFYSKELNLGLNLRSSSGTFELSAKGDADWSRDNGLRLQNAKITTLQTPMQGQPRFAGEWEGSLNATATDRWQLDLQGLLDRHPGSLSLQRSQNSISGSLKQSKLDLGNYADLIAQTDLSEQSGRLFPAKPLTIAAEIEIGTLQTRAAQISNIRTTLNLDHQRARLQPLSAELYSGQTSGSLTISNQNPLQYRLIQQAQNVYIQPLLQDLFRQSQISGKGTAKVDLTASGSTRGQLLHSLEGNASLDIYDGEWTGISLNRIREMLGGGTAESDPAAQAMPFEHFVFGAQIKQGISRHQSRAALSRPAADMSSTGEVNLANGQIREDIVFQGKDGNGKHTPLPVRVGGSFAKPTLSLNYQKITSGKKSAAEKQQALSDTLTQQWQWLLNTPKKP